MSTGNAETLRRLQFRVQNHGEAPTPQSSSSPTAPSFPSLPPPPQAMNGHAPSSNGYSSSTAQFAALHQPPLSRMSALLFCISTLRSETDPHPGTAVPTYFFKDSPFFQVRELILGNITLEGTSPSPCRHCPPPY